MRFLIALAATTLVTYAMAAEKGLKPRNGTLEHITVPPVEWLSPEEAFKQVHIHEDFNVELVANEPDIIAPVEIMFDEAGRMWVCEMQDFMPAHDDFGGAPISRIVVLEDTNRDGSYDSQKVFLDGLSFPRAMARVSNGIVVAEGRQVWHCIDEDGDLKCDEKRSLGAFAVAGNMEHSENALRRSWDNWYYAAKSSRRFKFIDGKMEAQETYTFLGQWGMAIDDYGYRYTTSNGTYMRTPDEFPPTYAMRTKNRDKMSEYYSLNLDKTTLTIRPNVGIRDGDTERLLDERGHLKACTAISGNAVYRGGGGWPKEYLGAVLSCEPAGNIASLLSVKHDNFQITADMVFANSKQFGKHNFIASTDELFRPINGAMGPDGCLYLVDMRCPILQYGGYMTPYLRNQILSRGLNQASTHGRIYRISHKKGKPDFKYPDLSTANASTLVATLSHDNGFWRDTAQRLIVEGNHSAAIPALKNLATETSATLPRIHALWSLHGLNAMTGDVALACLSETDQNLRVAALRTSEHLIGDHAGLRTEAIKLASSKEHRLRVQALLSLGAGASHPDVKAALMASNEKDSQSKKAKFNSLGEAAPSIIATIKAKGKPSNDDLTLVEDMAKQIGFRDQETVFRNMITTAVENKTLREPIIKGLVAGIRAEVEADFVYNARRSKKNKKSREQIAKEALALPMVPGPKPIETVSGFDQLKADSKIGHLVDNIEIYAHWGTGGNRGQALKASLARGNTLFRDKCSTCHGRRLEGTELAPSLMESDLLVADHKTAIRIVLHGLMGERHVGGKTFNGVMPGLATMLNDQEVADILSFARLRRIKDDNAAVSAEMVNSERTTAGQRYTPWTTDELAK